MKKIQVNTTNKNDLIKIFGEPSTKSTFDTDVWIYIERKITNTHFLGKRELIVNNVLVLEIDNRGKIRLSMKVVNQDTGEEVTN